TDGEVYVDGTMGAGGYTRGILDAAKCQVMAIDRDPSVQGFADQLTATYAERFQFLPGRFGEMASLLGARGLSHVNGIVLDIGVSSMQLDEATRGFSFKVDGPLDMRMSGDGPTAADVVNGYDEKDLADIIYIYGEEKASRRIARAIVRKREEQLIERTSELANIIRSVVRSSKFEKKDPATRTFQALRIYVNEELKELELALHAALSLLSPEGRLVVVVFHSLEDRIVKRFFAEQSRTDAGVSRHIPAALSDAKKLQPNLRLLTKKALSPSDNEMQENPRSRSAKLRAAVRTAYDIHPKEAA
ncbi:MAG: 16S rRNA (cytosine(1402)-N(4))-methyltransferase RsmH, partial [Rickettsiales bacterium]|nr:16S rRNA (cytosine(1402)-N(4))-methyltransferase RsmH [Rickettsiales bacterium]